MKLIITPETGVPRGIKCRVCKKIAREGQIILWESHDMIGHLVWHKSCLESIIEVAPDDLDTTIDEEYTTIQSQYEKGMFA